MKKTYILTLFVLASIISISGQAQERMENIKLSNKETTITISGQKIKVAPPLLNKAKKEVTFTLENAGSAELKSGSTFLMTLPRQVGYSYDLNTLTLKDGKPIPQGSPATIINLSESFPSGSSVFFRCKLIKDTSKSNIDQYVLIAKHN